MFPFIPPKRKAMVFWCFAIGRKWAHWSEVKTVFYDACQISRFLLLFDKKEGSFTSVTFFVV